MISRDAVAQAPTAPFRTPAYARQPSSILARMAIMLACALALLAPVASAAPAGAAPTARGAPINVLVAASFSDVMQTLITDYNRRTGKVIRPVYNSSAALARQIESHTGGDLFLSSDSAWVDYLVRKKAIDRKDRYNVIGNRLVLVTASNSRLALRIADNMPLVAALGANGKLAIADPNAIPAGRFTQAALTRLKVWSAVRSRLAPNDNARNTLALVAAGTAPLGIVLQSEAKLESRVRVLDTFATSLHPKLVHEAVLARGASEDARAFLRYLQGPDARSLFLRFGYAPLP